MEAWKALIRKSIEAHQKAEDLQKKGDEIGCRTSRKLEKLYDAKAEEELRQYLTEQYVAQGEEVGMSRENVMKHINLGAKKLDLGATITKGKWHIDTCRDEPKKIRMIARLNDLKRQMEAIELEMDLLVVNKETA